MRDVTRLVFEKDDSRAADRGLALWHAVQDVTRTWPFTDDVMGVGRSGDEIVVIRVHCIDMTIFDGTKPTQIDRL